eukprot:gene27972-biopygen14624
MNGNNAEDAAVLALVDKCPRISHANFHCCMKLTDAAVLALAEKCPESTHGTFGGDFSCKLTGADVLALADKCPSNLARQL